MHKRCDNQGVGSHDLHMIEISTLTTIIVEEYVRKKICSGEYELVVEGPRQTMRDLDNTVE